MKRKLSALIVILMVVIIAAIFYGYDFFNVRFNFYKSCHALYSMDNIDSIESRIKAEALNKSENGIWISEPVYFQNVNQLHIAIITKDDMFKIRAKLSSEHDKSVHENYTVYTTSRFLMFKSYQICFELPEPVQGEKYTIEVVRIPEQGNQQPESLGKTEFIFGK